MSVNEAVVSALSSFGLPVAESLYEGEQDEFFFFDIVLDSVADAGDDAALEYVQRVNVHYVTSDWSKDYAPIKKQVRAALEAGGFTAADVVDASLPKDRIRHIVFECEIDCNDLEE